MKVEVAAGFLSARQNPVGTEFSFTKRKRRLAGVRMRPGIRPSVGIATLNEREQDLLGQP